MEKEIDRHWCVVVVITSSGECCVKPIQLLLAIWNWLRTDFATRTNRFLLITTKRTKPLHSYKSKIISSVFLFSISNKRKLLWLQFATMVFAIPSMFALIANQWTGFFTHHFKVHRHTDLFALEAHRTVPCAVLEFFGSSLVVDACRSSIGMESKRKH